MEEGACSVLLYLGTHVCLEFVLRILRITYMWGENEFNGTGEMIGKDKPSLLDCIKMVNVHRAWRAHNVQ